VSAVAGALKARPEEKSESIMASEMQERGSEAKGDRR
jgi:hypothetical protein